MIGDQPQTTDMPMTRRPRSRREAHQAIAIGVRWGLLTVTGAALLGQLADLDERSIKRGKPFRMLRSTLGERIGRSTTTVDTHKAALAQGGWLRWEQFKNFKDGSWHQEANGYTLWIPAEVVAELERYGAKRSAEFVQPAGRVTPSPKPGGKGRRHTVKLAGERRGAESTVTETTALAVPLTETERGKGKSMAAQIRANLQSGFSPP